MGNINYRTSTGGRTKQWLAAILLAIPMISHALVMTGLSISVMDKFPGSAILNLLSALGFFLLWRIAANRATRTAAKIATLVYALWSVYFAVLELTSYDQVPMWIIHIVTGAQIITPLILAYTASLIAQNNRLAPSARVAVWIICVMCIVESYWALANSGLSLWIFDGMAAGEISVSAFREVYRWFVVTLDILAIIAFARICTSCAFNNHHDPNEPDPEYTPLNRYTIISVAITLVLIAIS